MLCCQERPHDVDFEQSLEVLPRVLGEGFLVPLVVDAGVVDQDIELLVVEVSCRIHNAIFRDEVDLGRPGNLYLRAVILMGLVEIGDDMSRTLCDRGQEVFSQARPLCLGLTL